ncbi:MAG: DUF1269 domain-containing protein [Acidimicrobiia bacterium]
MADGTTLAAISFPDRFRATEFLTAMQRLTKQGHLLVQDAVFVTKAEDGRTDMEETTDLETGQAAMGGALWSGLFGLLLGGPIGMVVAGGIGAGAGAVTAKAVDLGIKDQFITELGEIIQPGTTTLALLVSHIDEEPLIAELKRFAGARYVAGDLPPDVLPAVRSALDDATS